MIQAKGLTIVIDSGPDFRQQMLREKVKMLDAIVFTHAHKDHIAGLDDVRAFNFIHQRPMDLYAEERVIRQIEKEFAYVFAEFKYPGIPEVIVHEIGNEPFHINQLEIYPIRVMHARLPVLGFRIGDFTYITDASHIPAEEMERIRGTKILVINALRKRRHISHFTLEEATGIIHQVRPEQAYITHISHQMGPAEEVERELPDGIRLAYDGLKVDL